MQKMTNMEDVKIDIFELEQIYQDFEAMANLMEAWCNQEKSHEINLILNIMHQKLEAFKEIVYDL